MTNSPNNKLDNFVRESLKDHEVPFNEAHWHEFEGKLDALPRVSATGKWRYSLNIFIGLIIAGSASAFIYSSVSPSSAPSLQSNKQASSSVSDNAITKNQVAIQKKENNVSVSSNAQTANAPVVNPSSDKTYSIFTSADISNSPSENNSNSNANTSNAVQNNNAYGSNNNVTNTDPNHTTVAGNVAPQKDAAGENIDGSDIQKQIDLAKGADKERYIFPDMMDKMNGPVYPTKESDTIKQKADKDIDGFYLNNPNGKANADSVKSFFDQKHKKADSTGIMKQADPKKEKSENDHHERY